MRRSNSWSYAERSWDHQETPDHGYGAMEEMEIVEQMEVVEKVEIVETMGAVEEPVGEALRIESSTAAFEGKQLKGGHVASGMNQILVQAQVCYFLLHYMFALDIFLQKLISDKYWEVS